MRISLTILLGFLLLGCSTPNSLTVASEIELVSQAVSSTNKGQMLPIGAKAKMGGETIELEVAQTPEQQEIGLMFRSSLPANRGMLFEFEAPRYTRFWMKNTIIPLDMIFLKGGEVKAIFANVPPCTSDPCKSYGPSVEIDRVIELPGGRAAELGLKVGDRVAIEFVKMPQ
ncbi:DUF192 domain-containing protein [Candidatus Gracilibacteria bacterium]|jgi:uncharacterized protein|nr:DUF192 domain-containing protein [Candidatus Gracilibacteria bacterium]NJM86231.1 DUF192 domain-containing protein [Hydrococcus sp. RU_2_2]NJP17713.1 DUF192 domain-containing protein [Hydrococcus sp. CRU_1_1]